LAFAPVFLPEQRAQRCGGIIASWPVKTGQEQRNQRLALEATMTKITLALAAAALAATTMTSVANADALRVGFGFPLGSFVAHSNENYDGRYYRRAEQPRYERRAYRDDVPQRRIVKVKQAARAQVADDSVKAPAIKTAKLEDKLGSDPATTTVIAKTTAETEAAAPSKSLTTGSVSPREVKTAVNTEKNSDADTATVEQATTHVCRRYSPAIAALIDVPCK
jgi:hypothetical protein